MTEPSAEPVTEFVKVDNCDLCEAAKITPWFYDDDVCWIAECEICETPMVVWRFHGKVPPRLVNPEAWPLYSERFTTLLGFAPAPLP